MKVAIFTPFALPELGANTMRVESMRAFFESSGIETKVFAPKREENANLHGYLRYKNIKEIFQIISKEKFDIVLGTSPPITHSFFALIAAKLNRVPFVLDIRDPWTYAYEGLGIYKKYDPKLWVYKLLEIISYNLCNRIFVVTSGIQKIIEGTTLTKSKIVLVPNGTDTSMFFHSLSEGKKMRKELNIAQNAKVCIYAGAFVQKDVDVMISHIAPVLKKTGTYFLMVSPCGEWEKKEFEKIAKLIDENGINDLFRFVNSKKFGFEKLYKYYSAADIGLDPLPQAMQNYCIPVKTYDLMACAVPIGAKTHLSSPLAQTIIESKAGFVAQNWSEFCKKLEAQIKGNNLKVLSNYALKASKKFERKISNKIALKELRDLLG